MGKKSPNVELGTLNNDQLDSAPAKSNGPQKGRRVDNGKNGSKNRRITPMPYISVRSSQGSPSLFSGAA